jgi:hypothetical protein
MRLHLFEFGDLAWFPALLRNAMTAYLAATYRMLPVAGPWAGIVSKALRGCATNRIVDLCSGAGGPLPMVLDQLAALGDTSVEVVRTDLYPGPDVLAVDARRVPSQLTGVRTIFAGFHHFRPEDARDILRNARDQGQPICVFEATRRHPLAILLTVLIPCLVLFVTLRVRPVRWSQLLFTYLIPVLPLTIAWDGFVSHLRTYSVAEMKVLTTDLETEEYRWQAGELTIPGVPFPLPFLTGGLGA